MNSNLTFDVADEFTPFIGSKSVSGHDAVEIVSRSTCEDKRMSQHELYLFEENTDRKLGILLTKVVH